jgi:hypothetical protein
MSYVLVNEQEERRKNELRDRFAFEAYKALICIMPRMAPEKVAEKCGEYADTMMSRLYPTPQYKCYCCGRDSAYIRWTNTAGQQVMICDQCSKEVPPRG